MVKENFKNIATDILNSVGGKDNISDIYHCATRLRIVVNNPDLVDQEKLKKVDGIKGVVIKGQEIQNFIGTKVNEYYSKLVPELHLNEKVNLKQDKSEKLTFKNALSKVLDFISGIVLPIMPVIVAAGFLLAILNMCKTFFGMNPKSGTAIVLTSIASAGFYYIPIFVGFQSAIKMKIPAAMGAFLGAILTFSDINNVSGLSFLGIHLPKMQYNGTLLTSILGVILLALIYKLFDKVMPKEITYFFTPLLSILIAAPLTLVIIGPISNNISFAIAGCFNWLSAKANWLAFTLYSALNPILVMFGIDKGFVPIAMNNVSELGYDTLIYPAALPSNAAMGAAAIAIAVFSKKKITKGEGFSAGFTGLMGITEPSIFGFLLPYRRALIGAISGGAIGGLVGGILHIKQGALMAPGFISLISYFVGKNPTLNFTCGIITWLTGIISSFVITTILLKSDKNRDQNVLFKNDTKIIVKKENSLSRPIKAVENFSAPVSGKVIPLNQVNDDMVAQKILGDGFAIIPSNGKIYSPVNGTISSIFKTKHAICLKSDNGLDILLHLGIDTVELKGKPFDILVKEKDKVERGQLIGKMDIKQITDAGKDPTVLVLITSKDKVKDPVEPTVKETNFGDTVTSLPIY
ncbi:glucose PTS transporter subunit IIA [uncultured Lactobacillus sp.]|uniref:glucose PTS transporter subunit IIA n=1 Tax=uncultured Lactobacillus sp. TaxID=153152 RepID=UPI0025FFCA1D|nr:glucose PTS transporter subunit IIA [uncultured Lactobacillus sp.]